MGGGGGDAVVAGLSSAKTQHLFPGRSALMLLSLLCVCVCVCVLRSLFYVCVHLGHPTLH